MKHFSNLKFSHTEAHRDTHGTETGTVIVVFQVPGWLHSPKTPNLRHEYHTLGTLWPKALREKNRLPSDLPFEIQRALHAGKVHEDQIRARQHLAAERGQHLTPAQQLKVA